MSSYAVLRSKHSTQQSTMHNHTNINVLIINFSNKCFIKLESTKFSAYKVLIQIYVNKYCIWAVLGDNFKALNKDNYLLVGVYLWPQMKKNYCHYNVKI